MDKSYKVDKRGKAICKKCGTPLAIVALTGGKVKMVCPKCNPKLWDLL